MAIESTKITSFFTNAGVPAVGLDPLITIWQVASGSETKVVNADVMTEIENGWYRYNFNTYDTELDYIITVDGGDTLPNAERYQNSGNESFRDDIADAVWNESTLDHLQPGTFGLSIATSDTDIENIVLDVNSLLTLVNLLLKFDSNRTKVDKVANTLTVYDDDGTTPIQVFDLLDSTGTPSTDEIAERVPQ